MGKIYITNQYFMAALFLPIFAEFMRFPHPLMGNDDRPDSYHKYPR